LLHSVCGCCWLLLELPLWRRFETKEIISAATGADVLRGGAWAVRRSFVEAVTFRFGGHSPGTEDSSR
jgi:hypothetical protein